MPDNNYVDASDWPGPVHDPDGTVPAQEPNPHGDTYWAAWQEAKLWDADALAARALADAQRLVEIYEGLLAAAQGRLNGLRDGLVEHHGRKP